MTKESKIKKIFSWEVKCPIIDGIIYLFAVIVLLFCAPVLFLRILPVFGTYSYELVSGISSYPTLHDGDYMVLDTSEKSLNNLERGDFVTIQLDSEDGGESIIKRIIALPNEEIAFFKDDEQNCLHTYIRSGDGDFYLLDEPYIKEPMTTDGVYQNPNGPYLLTTKSASSNPQILYWPEGGYFVMGDNRNNSLDSRKLGRFEKEQITGKVLYVYRISTKASPLGFYKYLFFCYDGSLNFRSDISHISGADI